MKAVLDHIGIAVKDLRAALAFYRDALGLEIEPPEDVASQAVRAHFVPVGESNLELLEATAAESAIARYVEKRGPGLHHITLRVDDIGAALAQLKGRGVRLVDERPRPGAEGALVAFVHPSSAHGVLVELKQAASHRAGASRPGGTTAPALTISRHALGELELVSLYDGILRVDGGALFGTVPRPAWTAEMPPDDRNRVALAIRPLLVRGVRTLLIDAGVGEAGAASGEDDAVDRARTLDTALAEAGIAPDQIDLVLATHLHRDHAGGFMRRDGAGAVRPRFPRARYVVRRGEWDAAIGSNDDEWYVRDTFAPLAEAGVLALVDEDQTIMPGVRVQRTGGHTMHHQIVWLESGGRRALYAAEVMPTRAHAPDRWTSGYDRYPMDTLTAKRELARQAAARDTLVFLAHDPEIAAGRLVDQHGMRRIVPAG